MTMLPTIRRTGWVLALALAVTAQASAQHRPPGPPVYRPIPRYYGGPFVGVGVGVGVGIGPGYAYPFGYSYYPWWGYPGGYNGFYSNGFSMYGPPVPTYGPQAGTFGASDQRIDAFRGQFPPYGVYGYGDEPPLAAPVVVEPPGAKPLTTQIDVHLPDPEAVVIFDGRDTGSTGADRTFRTPPLNAGPLYKFDIVARWTEGGQPVEKRETIQFRAGQRVRVTFEGNGNAEPMPAPLPAPRQLPKDMDPPIKGPELK